MPGLRVEVDVQNAIHFRLFWRLMQEASRRRIVSCFVAGLLVALAVLGDSAFSCAQASNPDVAPARIFEVATVRPSRADGGFENYQLSSARFHVENAPLTALIRFAYDIRSDDQLPREPSWIAQEKFDIDAKVDDSDVEAMGKLVPDQKLEQYRLMLQTLLEERFKLKVSTHIKDLPVYALVVAKGGPKITVANIPPEAMARRTPVLAGGSKGELQAQSVSMALFTRWLSGRDDMGNRVVIDGTGLQGSFDFTLRWTLETTHSGLPEGTGAVQGAGIGQSQEPAGPSISTALQEQLGLKLESRRAPVEVLVIEHVDKPSQN